MKLGPLLEMNAIRTTPAKVEVYITNPNGVGCRMIEINTLNDYLKHRDKEIEDWNYYTGPDGMSDKIIVHLKWERKQCQ